jgi:hypothetical protein
VLGLLLDLESREIPENEKQKEKVYAVLLFVTRGKETNKQTIRVQWRSALFIVFFFFFYLIQNVVIVLFSYFDP